VTGLPMIHAQLGFSQANLAWVQSAYTLTFGGFLLLGARAGDILGRRRMFVAGLALFTLASLAIGTSRTAGWMLSWRAIQGMGGGGAGPIHAGSAPDQLCRGHRARCPEHAPHLRTTIPDRAEMIRIIRAAYDRGVTLFDTAEAYGPFEDERILGEAAQPFRRMWFLPPSSGGTSIRTASGLRARLSTAGPIISSGRWKRRSSGFADYLDLVYQHRVDPAVPIGGRRRCGR
jgi:hypothetical protein